MEPFIDIRRLEEPLRGDFQHIERQCFLNEDEPDGRLTFTEVMRCFPPPPGHKGKDYFSQDHYNYASTASDSYFFIDLPQSRQRQVFSLFARAFKDQSEQTSTLLERKSPNHSSPALPEQETRQQPALTHEDVQFIMESTSAELQFIKDCIKMRLDEAEQESLAQRLNEIPFAGSALEYLTEFNTVLQTFGLPTMSLDAEEPSYANFTFEDCLPVK